MRKSLPRVISWCVIGLLTVAVFQFETGGRTPSGVASDATQLLRAQQLLRALYPELRNKNYVMSVEASGAFDMDWTSLPVLSVEIGPAEKGHKEYIADKSGTVRTVHESPVFGAMVALDTYGRVLDLSARARDILSGERNERLRKQVDSHRQWTSPVRRPSAASRLRILSLERSLDRPRPYLQKVSSRSERTIPQQTNRL